MCSVFTLWSVLTQLFKNVTCLPFLHALHCVLTFFQVCYGCLVLWNWVKWPHPPNTTHKSQTRGQLKHCEGWKCEGWKWKGRSVKGARSQLNSQLSTRKTGTNKQTLQWELLPPIHKLQTGCHLHQLTNSENGATNAINNPSGKTRMCGPTTINLSGKPRMCGPTTINLPETRNMQNNHNQSAWKPQNMQNNHNQSARKPGRCRTITNNLSARKPGRCRTTNNQSQQQSAPRTCITD